MVTGASSGIGAALAREFARLGADLVVAAQRLPLLRDLAADLEATGRRALAVACDVTEEGAVERAVQRALETFGRLDVVVANAGFGIVGPFERLTLDDYRRQFETNVFGVLRTVSAALPAQWQQRRWSRGGRAAAGGPRTARNDRAFPDPSPGRAPHPGRPGHGDPARRRPPRPGGDPRRRPDRAASRRAGRAVPGRSGGSAPPLPQEVPARRHPRGDQRDQRDAAAARR